MSRMIHRELPVDLSEEELLKLSKELANRQIAHMDIEAQAKAATTEWRDKVKHSKLGLEEVANAIKDKRRFVMIECVEEYDHARQMIIVTRQDTGESIEFRAATEDEITEHEARLQGDLYDEATG